MAAVIDQYTSRATMFGVTPAAGTLAMLRSNDITGGRTTSLWVYLTDGGWTLVGHPANNP